MVLQNAENDRRVRNFFRSIKQHQKFNPRWSAIRNLNWQILVQSETKALRWKDYILNLLNYAIPDNPIPHTEYQRADLQIENLNLKEVEAAILKLKNWKNPWSEDMATKLMKRREKEVHKAIYTPCQEIWNEKQIPESWYEATIISLHKKGD